MHPVAFNDTTVNLSATRRCDADRATLISTASAATANGLNTPLQKTTQESKEPSLEDSSALEKGDPLKQYPTTLRKASSNGDSCALALKKKKPFLHGIRTSKHFITMTILLALFTDMSAYGIVIPIAPGIIQEMGGDSTDTGILVAVYAAGIMSASPIFGILSDKMASRRFPMMIGLAGLLAATVIFIFARVYWLLIFARFFQGVSGGAIWTLGLALMTDSFNANEMGVQMGKALIGHTMGLLGGPPIGGLLHDAFGSRAPFYFSIVFACIVMICFLLLIEERAEEVLEIRRYEVELRERAIAAGNPYTEEIKTSIWQLITAKRMIAAVAVTTLEAFDLSTLEPTLPYYLKDRFSMTEGQVGLVFIAFTMPTIISPLAGWVSDRYGAKVLCSCAVTACGCFMLLLSIENKPLWAIIVVLIGIGLSTSSFIAPILGEISAVVRRTGDKAAYARAFAIFNIAFSFGMVIGPIMAGYIYKEHGFKWNCITTACILFAFVPLMACWMGNRQAKMEDVAMYEREEEERQRMLSEIEILKAENLAAEEANARTLY
ncbi:hypothetical protein EMPS_10316 [Entomortierella parvispora]|uniref:Major facilitator superfamily (MFS) profile domain-containing protein n=1 Tax=Entomortierella parvispora TaxID=205924 RepID=A0A9P3HKK7_9FUNG|nr:hypothetical protein EMPS_10316 [Entomortierella parvispora]